MKIALDYDQTYTLDPTFVWIDDKPESILENSSATPEWLVEWRASRVG